MFNFFSSIWYIAARFFYDDVSTQTRRKEIYSAVEKSRLRQRSSREKKSCVGDDDDDRGDFFAFSFLDKIIGEDF